ncbi:MSC_0622 family F1-like ATPase gamma subunit [Mycoplasmopsis alligatoris]|uniref:ATP synthase F1, gamma subunit n=1 Tax=Mycoplasmopsis alligatoris A21JP2 TaxID=747682 RepID=D4XVL7_9BACT|nr:hypothetical protein [Mycoplasmopsis alligatoris]EFF41612.1 conserved hypothetical protein [Mycoplasmopsis alligatoris A21JP2]
MDQKKLKQKLNVLNSSQMVLEVEKSLSLLTIFKLSKALNINMHRAYRNKRNIDYVSGLINSTHDYLYDRTLTTKASLWIYVTEVEKYEVDAYTRYEKVILKRKTNDDIFITIGTRANNFAKTNNLKTLQTFESTEDQNLVLKLISIIKTTYNTGQYSSVRMVVNSNKIHDRYMSIVPVNQVQASFWSYDGDQNQLKIDKKFIYPNADSFIENEINNYLMYIVQSLLIESSFYTAKNKLVSENKLLNKIEDDIFTIKRKLARIKSEKQIEEIVMLAKNKSFMQAIEDKNE